MSKFLLIILLNSCLLLTTIAHLKGSEKIDDLNIDRPHQCLHDQLFENMTDPYAPKHQKRKLATYVNSGTAQSIRITYDYSSLQTSVTNTSMRAFLEDQMKAAKTFYERRLKVMRLSSPIIPPSECVYSWAVPEADVNNGIPNSDFHLYVTAEYNNTQNFLAWATKCSQDYSDTWRPLVGRLNFNTYYIKDLSAAAFAQTLDTTLHEIAHALVFDKALYDKYIKPDGFQWGTAATESVSLRGITTSLLKTPAVTAWAKKFYDCSSITGMQLENQGSSGSQNSHWERTVTYDEVMTASRLGPTKTYSALTFAIFKDSGWYIVDDTFSSTLSWGYKRGCDFYTKGCQDTNKKYSEFCTYSNYPGCTSNYINKGTCVTSQLSLYFLDSTCGFILPLDNQACIDSSAASVDYSASQTKQTYTYHDSRCFDSSLGGGTQKCYKYKCTNSGTIEIYLGSDTAICTKSFQEINDVFGMSGTIFCPDIDRFCNSGRKLCPNWCSSKGYCTDGICNCRSGSAGLDCSQTECSNNYYLTSNANCVQNCQSNEYGNQFNRMCMACDLTCQQCSKGGIYGCTTCATGLNKHIDGSCLTQCPDGYYADGSLTCQVCHTDCFSCSGPNNNQCIKCQNKDYYLESGACVANCVTLQYKDEAAKKCLASCPLEKVPNQQTNICEMCASGTYKNTATTSQCLNPDQCGIGKYPDQTIRVCASCNSECKTCTGGSNSECSTCYSGTYYFGKRCVTQCPMGSYKNDSNLECTSCHSNCFACTGNTNDVCSQCNVGFFLSGTTCGTSCPDQQYPDLVFMKCMACNETCQTCRNSRADDCLTCPIGKFMLVSTIGKRCIAVCPDGYYISTSECLRCHSTCITCQGASESDCLKCKPKYNFLLNKCLSRCPDGYYADENQLCQTCDSSCKTCQGAEQNQCLSCGNTTFLSGTNCISACPADTPGNQITRICQSINIIVNFGILITIISLIIM